VTIKRKILVGLGFSLALSCLTANAQPWLDAGDLGLRHDLRLLADHGIITAPVSMWPVSAPDVARDLYRFSDAAQVPSHVAAAWRRMKDRIDLESKADRLKPAARLSVGTKPSRLRGFQAIPREQREASAEISGMGTTWSYRLRTTWAGEPQDDKPYRLDGSYLSLLWGNLIMTAGIQDRWWGPGQDGGLILTSNARPAPGISLQRARSKPFETRLLRWLGPWNINFFANQLEGDRAIPRTRLLGGRLMIRPLKGFEFGMSRTAQWDGEGRPDGFGSVADVVIGNDNDNANAPSNQIGGFDLRLSRVVWQQSVSVWSELTGEDEAGLLPSKRNSLFGLGLAGALGDRGAAYRLHLEYADTGAGFASGEDRFNVSYEHSEYLSGYRYRGRVMGHTMDNDSQQTSLGMVFTGFSARLQQFSVIIRHARLNRDGTNVAIPGGNSATRSEQKLFGLTVDTQWQLFANQKILAHVGYEALEAQVSGQQADDIQASISWLWNQ